MLFRSIQQTSKDGFVLIQSSIPSNVPTDWYETNILDPFRKFLLEQEIVFTQNKTAQKLKFTKFPKPTEISSPEMNSDFWSVTLPIIGDSNVPLCEDLNDWVFAIQKNYELWDHELFYSLENLIEEFNDINIEQLKQKTNIPTDIFLNTFYLFLQKYDLPEVLRNNKLTPDRKSTRLNSSHTDISRMPSSA